MRLSMTVRFAQMTVVLATGMLASQALAATQPPHDVAGGTACVRCHIPYGSVNDSAQATGAATAGSSSTALFDAGKTWTTGTWTGAAVTFTSGANLGQYRMVTASTTTSLSWTDPLPSPLAAGDTYQVSKTTYDDIEAKCRSCHSATGSASTMTNVGLHVVNGGSTVIGCGKCHEPHNVDPNTGRGNGLLRLSIRWPTAKAQVVYPSGGPNPFIVAAPPYNGICQVCHTQTKHHRNDGTLSDHYPEKACTDCHAHQNRFMHGSGGTGCGDCHGHDQGYPLGGGKVSLGAKTFQSHSTHTENDSDDVRGPNVDCATCHNTNNFPYFNSGTDLNGDGKIALNEADVCESCHSSSGTYDGVNDPAFGAKNNWQGGVYNADNATLKTGKDRWCAGCHDEAPSYIGGVQAPWVAGEESVPTEWGTTGYGFYKTGHGLPSNQAYPWTLKAGSPQQRQGAGLTCEACHNTAAAHIDGVVRSYSNARTPANYQAGYRLKSVNNGVPMQIPRVYQGTDALVKPEDFPLCLGCHNARPFTSATSPAATNYRDDTSNRNDHNFHLARQEQVFRSDWAADASVSDSRPTCITCHNVHGSTQIAMVNDGLLTSRGMNLSYSNAASGTPPVGLSLADSASTGWHEYQTQYSAANPSGLCAQNCHNNTDPNAWRYYGRTPYDVAGPAILQAFGASASNLVSVRFSKPVYGPTGAALTAADFVLADASGRTITTVDHVAGGSVALVTLSAVLDGGLHVDTIAPSTSPAGYDHDGIYDVLGNRLPQSPVVIGGSDTTPPTMTVGNPDSGTTGAPASGPLTFTLADSESGVLWSSVTVTLSGSLGYAGSYTSASPQLTRTGSAASTSASLTPTVSFSYNETIAVTVHATDAMGNALPLMAWTFTTAAAPAPVTVRLHPSGAGSTTDGWSISPLNAWATALDSNDDGTSYAQGTGTATTFYANLDDPAVFSGAVQSISITALIQINSGTGTFPFTLGWRVGSSGASQSVAVTVANTDGWATKTVAVDGVGLTYADIVNLQAFVTRSTTGSHTDRVTEVYADVTYLP